MSKSPSNLLRSLNYNSASPWTMPRTSTEFPCWTCWDRSLECGSYLWIVTSRSKNESQLVLQKSISSESLRRFKKKLAEIFVPYWSIGVQKQPYAGVCYIFIQQKITQNYPKKSHLHSNSYEHTSWKLKCLRRNFSKVHARSQSNFSPQPRVLSSCLPHDSSTNL